MREKLYTLAFMVVLAAVFTAAVSAVQLATRERIRLNQELAQKGVILRVLGISAPPGAGPRELLDLYEKRVKETGRSFETPTGTHPILAGYSDSDELLGYAFETSGRGFWDKVRGYLAVGPDLKKALGIAFFQQNETPGLGAEITKPWFDKQFQGLPLPEEPGPDGQLIHLVPPGEEKGKSDVDAVTGATQTSKAVQRFLNEDLKLFLRAMQDGDNGPPSSAVSDGERG
jgi:Na+-transporting NADH:ubiquinone oxidoreductase subunit C